MLTLGVQGWNFVKSIFGRKEKRCLMGVLIVQAIMLSLEYYQDFFPIGIAYHDIFLFAAMTDFVSVVVMIIYLFIRKAGTRSHKAAENLRKYQLFRFVYIMIVICFYLVGIIVSILVRVHIYE